MNLKGKMLVWALCLAVTGIQAQQKAPENWFTLDPTKDNVAGTGADEALAQLKAKGKKGKLLS
jgi:hypothetical protein